MIRLRAAEIPLKSLFAVCTDRSPSGLLQTGTATYIGIVTYTQLKMKYKKASQNIKSTKKFTQKVS